MNKHFVFFVAEDSYFLSHRLGFARAIRDAGFRVSVLTNVKRLGDAISREGFGLYHLDVRRSSVDPFSDLRSLARIRKAFGEMRPDIVHNVAMKPVIYGTIAARAVGVPVIVNALAGMGYAFTGRTLKAKMLGVLISQMLRATLTASHARAILQNTDDLEWLIARGIARRSRCSVIPGTGVDASVFSVREISTDDRVRRSADVHIGLVARMLYDKGITEFVDAIAKLRSRGLSVQGHLIGSQDDNPASIPVGRIKGWEQGGGIVWHGHQVAIEEWWARMDICALPSYREGFPKSLLEAAACGKPLVSCDTQGCRDLVQHGVNGYLVPPRDSASLADCLEVLCRDAELRKAMGEKSRQMVESKYDGKIIESAFVDAHLGLVNGGLR